MKLVTVIVFLTVTQFVFPQDTKTIYGKLKSRNGDVVQDAIVSIGKTSKMVHVRKDGSFKIKAAPGDSLLVHTGRYYSKTWIVPGTKADIIFPEIELMAKLPGQKTEPVKKTYISGPVMVMGTVMDAQSKVLPGASVLVKGTFSGVATNNMGSFHIEAKGGDTLEIHMMGFKTRYFSINEGSDAIYREVVLERDTTLLDEVEVTPWLTREMMSYEKLPMDASEINRMYLREKAVYTDKSRFKTVSFNFAPLIMKYIGKGFDLIAKSKNRKKQDRINIMRQKVLQNAQKTELHQDSIQ